MSLFHTTFDANKFFRLLSRYKEKPYAWETPSSVTEGANDAFTKLLKCDSKEDTEEVLSISLEELVCVIENFNDLCSCRTRDDNIYLPEAMAMLEKYPSLQSSGRCRLL